MVQSTLSPKAPWRRYGQSILLVIIATILGQPIHFFIEPTNLVMIYLLVVVISAIWLGRGPAIVSALLGVLAFDIFFIPPQFTLGVADTQYLLTFAGLLLVGVVISALAAHANIQADTARRRELQAIASYELSRGFAAVSEASEILTVFINHVASVFDSEVAVFVVHREAVTLQVATSGFVVFGNEEPIAVWVLRHRRAVSPGTKPFAANGHYLPLQTAQRILGVLCVKREPPTAPFTEEQHRLLDSFTSQAALALERAQLAEQAQEAQLLRTREELQTALLNSISHDIRTPLASITGALSTLLEKPLILEEKTRRDLLENAWGEAERLNGLVSNLLDMARLESGALIVRRDPGDVQDLIGVSLARFEDRRCTCQVILDIPDDLPLVPMDFVLMVQVMVNLLDNAFKYSDGGLPITVGAAASDTTVAISVADQGIGIPEDEREKAFAKFYRVPRIDEVPGTGLGLSICKGIVEAHDGAIWIENGIPNGTVVTVALPVTPPEERRRQP